MTDHRHNLSLRGTKQSKYLPEVSLEVHKPLADNQLDPLATYVFSLLPAEIASQKRFAMTEGFVIARSEATWRSHRQHCHPEQRDCLRPLAGRIYSLIIRFFAKEAQNDWNIVWEDLTTVAS